jgi:hypothetical protein
LGPAAKRFYAQIISRLEDSEKHLRYLASSTLACTFPPAAASRLIVHKMLANGEGKKPKIKIKGKKINRLPKEYKEVYVDALSKLLRGTHRKYAKEFLPHIVHWTTDIRSASVRNSSLQMLLDVRLSLLPYFYNVSLTSLTPFS